MLNFNSQMRPGLHFMVLASLVVILFSAVLMSAQTAGTSSIQGTITDQTGAVVTGAKVTITSRATGGWIRVVTTTTGTFASGSLQPGDYTVRVEAKDFKSGDLPITTQSGVISAIRLQLGQGNQLVLTHSNVYSAQVTVQGVLKADSIDMLPVNGRSYQDLSQLEPGVQSQDGTTFDPTKNGFSSTSFQSRYARSPRVEVDGVDITDETVGATTQNIPASAIQEFNLSQSTLDVSTELTSSGAVNIITRSGSNQFHGQAFGYFRGDQIAAKLPGTPAPTFQREQFGGRAGGYLIKDKLFWFLAAERTKQDLTAAQPFSAPFNVLPASISEPFREFQADGKLDWQVKPNAHAFYRFGFDQNNQTRPYGVSSSTQLFKNNNHTPSHTLGYDFSTGAYTHSLRFEYLKFSNGIADSTSGIAAGINNPIPGLGINIGAPVSGNCALSGGGSYCGGPSYLSPQATYQSDLEFRYDGSHANGNHVFRYGATFNHILGGGSASFAAFPQVGTSSVCLSPFGNCLTSSDPTAYRAEDVFLGNGVGFSTPNSAFGLPGGRLGPDNRIEAYVGDGWKATHNLTLTYGLHYLRDTGRVNTNLGSEPILNQWVPGLGNTVRTPSTNFAPQFGFVWDMAGKGKTVIRGGGGLFYENSIWNNALFDSPARLKQGVFAYTPLVCSNSVPSAFVWPTNPGLVGTPIAGGAGVVVAGTNMVQPTFCGGTISSVASDILALSSAFQSASASHAGSQPNPNFIGTTLNAANANGFNVFDPNYRTPRSWQMNLGFQHEFRPGTVVSADYIRVIGLHYLLGVDRNSSGAARSYNQPNAIAARDAAQLANGCPAGLNQASCMVTALGQAGAQLAYSTAGLDSNSAVTGGAPCSFCAFPGITPFGQNNNGAGAGNGSLGTLDMLEPVGRSVYSGIQIRLAENINKQWHLVKGSSFQVSYSISKFVSQAQDQDFINLATNNDKPLQYTGPNALDRRHQISFGGTFDLPFFTKLSLVGHFYSPLPQDLRLPELTNGGEIFATDWLGSGLGSGAAPEPVPGTQIGQFMRGTQINNLQTVISSYNTHFGNTLTPAGHCLVNDGQCPGAASIAVMTQADMSTLGWVMPTIAPLAPAAQNFPWLKSLDLRAAWPIKIHDRFTIQPSASVFNVFNFANAVLPGNLPSASLLPGGINNTLSPGSLGGVNGANLSPFRASFQSGTYALGAPRQLEFGLSLEF